MTPLWIALGLAAMAAPAPGTGSAQVMEATRPAVPGAAFQGWNPRTRAQLVTLDRDGTTRLYEIAAPGAEPRLLSPEGDRIGSAAFAKRTGDVIVVRKAGDGRLYTLTGGTLTPLADGGSRTMPGAWSRDGKWIAYTSTRRTGTDADIYVVDPRYPKTDRLVARVSGGGWSVAGFTADGTSALLLDRSAPARTDLYLMDIESGAMRALRGRGRRITYGAALFSYDGLIWATAREGAKPYALGIVDPGTGAFTPVADGGRADVTRFDVSADGKTIAFLVDEGGVGRLKLLDTATRRIRPVEGLPAGAAAGLEIAPWGDIGLSIASAGALDSYAVDPATLQVTRWTGR